MKHLLGLSCGEWLEEKRWGAGKDREHELKCGQGESGVKGREAAQTLAWQLRPSVQSGHRVPTRGPRRKYLFTLFIRDLENSPTIGLLYLFARVYISTSFSIFAEDLGSVFCLKKKRKKLFKEKGIIW